jgi:hypothetical protein
MVIENKYSIFINYLFIKIIISISLQFDEQIIFFEFVIEEI